MKPITLKLCLIATIIMVCVGCVEDAVKGALVISGVGLAVQTAASAFEASENRTRSISSNTTNLSLSSNTTNLSQCRTEWEKIQHTRNINDVELFLATDCANNPNDGYNSYYGVASDLHDELKKRQIRKNVANKPHNASIHSKIGSIETSTLCVQLKSEADDLQSFINTSSAIDAEYLYKREKGKGLYKARHYRQNIKLSVSQWGLLQTALQDARDQLLKAGCIKQIANNHQDLKGSTASSSSLAQLMKNTTDESICVGVTYGYQNYIAEGRRRGLRCDFSLNRFHSFKVTELNKNLVANANSIIRAMPSVESNRLSNLASGEAITVTGWTEFNSSKWYRVKTAEHDEAYVFAGLLTEPTVKIAASPAPIARPVAKVMPITQGKRTALVIGNSRYTELRRLRNPRDDAEAVSKKLTSIGFDVVKLIDADKRQIERALRDFGDRSQSATISIVYYAGHGLQVEGKNYLLPVDARIRKRRDLNYEVIELSTVMAELQSDKRANIIILDSCRDNPLTAQYASNYRSIGATRGLAVPISSTIGTLIAFATAPNKVAADGSGKHSPYTSAFLKWIDKPNLEIGEVFRRIREDVVKATGGQQVPWENSSLIGGGIYLTTSN